MKDKAKPWNETVNKEHMLCGGLITLGLFKLFNWDHRAFRVDHDLREYWCKQVCTVALVDKVKVDGVNAKSNLRFDVIAGVVLTEAGAVQPFPKGLKWSAADCSVHAPLHVALTRVRPEG